jgi:hypothetical protein
VSLPSFPPSHLVPPPLSAGVLRALRSTQPHASPLQRDNPRVQVFPSADGTVLLIGITAPERKWVAEYRCLAEDFDGRCVAAMERRVRQKERAEGPRLMR